MAVTKIWYLEGYAGSRRALQRIRLFRFPFRVGRDEGSSLTLDSNGISREHAELSTEDGNLVLRDLGSTNGTFLNHERIHGPVRVESGDIIHFAEEEFRLQSEEKIAVAAQQSTREGIATLSENLPVGGRELLQLLMNRQVAAVFQPIVEYGEGRVHAWEMLGRGTHPGLAASPGALFRIAESLGEEVRFSELLRRAGVVQAHAARPDATYFTNIHPNEMNDTCRLLACMDELRRDYPDLAMVMEIHEAAIADKAKLQLLRDHLRNHGIRIAYDDFGRGQARLVELADVPPDYIKLDIDLVKDVDRSSSAKQQMVKMLADYARDHDIRVIAEGVNTDGELAFCLDLDIDLLQSFRFGGPGELDANDDR